MKSPAAIALSLAFAPGVAGCAHGFKSDRESQVVVVKENPRNGMYDTSPIRADVVKYRCSILYRQCTTVRIVHEIGTDDVFTYVGDYKPLSVSWKDAQTLEIQCSGCNRKTVKLRLPEMDYIHIVYES